jgi:hypothetical protein
MDEKILTDNYNNRIIDTFKNYELVKDSLGDSCYVNLIIGLHSSGNPIRNIIAKFENHFYAGLFLTALKNQ